MSALWRVRVADRVLTTHTGSLPRPEDVFALLEEKERTGVEPEGFAERIGQAVSEIVAEQAGAGIDIVGDGEVSKFSYTFYVRHRLNGVGSLPEDKFQGSKSVIHRDLADHPEVMERLRRKTAGVAWYEMVPPPACLGPVSYTDTRALERDLANLRAALEASSAEQAFVSAASPGVLTKFVPNHYYGDEDAYVEALAAAMRTEYRAIHDAGFVLQIDCPDLASARHNQYQHLSTSEFLKVAARNIEALNHATRDIPPEAMRMHVCWGNYEGPHTHDIPFRELAATVFTARPQAILFEAANPRHSHEWEDFQELPIPDDRVLVPGVIDTTTNFVEHPQLIAQRIVNFAKLVGKDRVIAGTDCGFATFAGPDNPVAPSVVWAKLKALSDGAGLANERLAS